MQDVSDFRSASQYIIIMLNFAVSTATWYIINNVYGGVIAILRNRFSAWHGVHSMFAPRKVLHMWLMVCLFETPPAYLLLCTCLLGVIRIFILGRVSLTLTITKSYQLVKQLCVKICNRLFLLQMCLVSAEWESAFILYSSSGTYAMNSWATVHCLQTQVLLNSLKWAIPIKCVVY